MPSNRPKYVKTRVIKGAAPRKGTPVAWPEGKPPRGKLLVDSKPQSKKTE